MATKTAASTKKKPAAKKKPSTKPKAAAKSAAKKPAKKTWKSRAALRLVEAGSAVECLHCGERVKFQAKLRNMQVICNIYTKGVWERVDHYHSECYDLADQPYGVPPDMTRPPGPASAPSKAATEKVAAEKAAAAKAGSAKKKKKS